MLSRRLDSWKAKDTTEIAINSIYTEHCEKERKYTKPKTVYTCNPFPSIEMNNGLGMRVPFVTDKVGYEAGQEAVEVGDDPDVKRVVDQLLGASKVPTEKYAEVSTSICKRVRDSAVQRKTLRRCTLSLAD